MADPILPDIRAADRLAHPPCTKCGCEAFCPNGGTHIAQGLCCHCDEGRYPAPVPASCRLSAEAFERDLAKVINRHSRENISNTPDHILARYLHQALIAFEATSMAREKWYGGKLEPARSGVPWVPDGTHVVLGSKP